MSKREFIMHSRSLENRIKQQGLRKIALFNQAKGIIENILDEPVKDLDRFAEGFRAYMYDELKKRHKGALDSVSYVQMIQLNNINDEQIKRLEIEFKKIGIKLDKTYTKLSEYDCAVYAETPEEIKRLREYQAIEKSTEGLIKKGIPIHWGNYTKAFYPITAIDGQKLTPNINYIKHNRTH